MKNQIQIFSLLLLILPIFFTSQLLSIPKHNIEIFTKSNNYYQGELVEINDSSLIIYYITLEKSGDFIIPISSISRLFIDEGCMNDLETKISIYSKNYTKREYQIKGIDFERNILYIDSVFLNPDNDIVHVSDSISLDDSSIVKFVIHTKTPIFSGLVKSPFYGLLTGAAGGALIFGIFSYNSIFFGEAIFIGGLFGGILGTSLGLTIGIIYIISEINNDIDLKHRKNIKYSLINYICYPEIINQND